MPTTARPCRYIVFCSTRNLEEPDDHSLRRRVNGPHADDVPVTRSAKARPGTPPRHEAGSASVSAPPCVHHHVALQTSNITRSAEFYSLFGYAVACRFRAGPARAAWLELSPRGHEGDAGASSTPSCAGGGRLELIEVPAHLFDGGLSPASSADSAGVATSPAREARQHRAVDAFSRPTYLGYHHVALDVTSQVRSMDRSSGSSGASDETSRATPGSHLGAWIGRLNATSVERFGKSLRLALPPRQQIIGAAVYKLAFLYDDSGCLVELLSRVGDRTIPMESGWEPWDGKGFVGDTK